MIKKSQDVNPVGFHVPSFRIHLFEAHQAAGVDVFIHENFLDAKTFAGVYDMPLADAKGITS